MTNFRFLFLVFILVALVKRAAYCRLIQKYNNCATSDGDKLNTNDPLPVCRLDAIQARPSGGVMNRSVIPPLPSSVNRRVLTVRGSTFGLGSDAGVDVSVSVLLVEAGQTRSIGTRNW